MTKATWDRDKAAWQPGKTMEVVKLHSGWCARFHGEGAPPRSFPHSFKIDAIQAAERLAQEYWGDFNPYGHG